MGTGDREAAPGGGLEAGSVVTSGSRPGCVSRAPDQGGGVRLRSVGWALLGSDNSPGTGVNTPPLGGCPSVKWGDHRQAHLTGG